MNNKKHVNIGFWTLTEEIDGTATATRPGHDPMSFRSFIAGEVALNTRAKTDVADRNPITLGDLAQLIQTDAGLKLVQQALAQDKRTWMVIGIGSKYDESCLTTKTIGITGLGEYAGASELPVGANLQISEDVMIFRTA